ncbi:MAG TPA: hypothetical protein VGG57_11145 [Stellaceae bacterium]|jgi:hypothetical protein
MAALTKMQKNVQKLIDERDRLRRELAEFTSVMTGRIAGLEMAISLLQHDGDEPLPLAEGKSGRGEAKTLLLDLLREVGTQGLNAAIAEQIAIRRGIVLKRGTAASNLSRLKADNVVVHDGERYRLPEFARQSGLVVVPNMAS